MEKEWKFKGRQRTCLRCEREFLEAEKHFSTLELAEGLLRRSDWCRACFKESGEEAALLWWRTVNSIEAKKGLSLDLDVVETLFTQLAGREETDLRELRYVLCLLLMRKRRVRVVRTLRGEETGGDEAFLVRLRGREELERVAVFDLSAERIDSLRSQLMVLLEGTEGQESEEETDGGEPASEPVDLAPQA